MVCFFLFIFVFFFKQKTAYEMRISDWSSDVCSSDLGEGTTAGLPSDEPLYTFREEPMNKALFEAGLKNRREVLGSAYVDKSIASADDFNMPMQEMVTAYCWGAVWGRAALPRKQTSMLNPAMPGALNRPERKHGVEGKGVGVRGD